MASTNTDTYNQVDDTYRPVPTPGYSARTSISGSAASGLRTTVMDSEGDIVLIVVSEEGKARFRVNSNTLCITSPVFRAMLGRNSRFKEASELSATRNANTQANISQPYEITLEDDNPKALAVVLRIIHMKSNLVPKSLDENQLYEVAIICDKYDMAQAVGLWTEKWIPFLVPDETKQSPSVVGPKWLFITYVFGRRELFHELSQEIILTSTTDESGALVMHGDEGTRTTQHIPCSVLNEISTRRHQCMESMMDCIHQTVDKYNNVEPQALQCKDASKNETCDSLILGFLLRTFKRKGVYPIASSELMQESIREVKIILDNIEFPNVVYFCYPRAPKDSYCDYCTTYGDRDSVVDFSGYCGECGSSQSMPELPKSNHSDSCSPIADFKKNIQAICDGVVGLDLGSFTRVNKDIAADGSPGEGQSLWDYIEFEE